MDIDALRMINSAFGITGVFFITGPLMHQWRRFAHILLAIFIAYTWSKYCEFMILGMGDTAWLRALALGVLHMAFASAWARYAIPSIEKWKKETAAPTKDAPASKP